MTEEKEEGRKEVSDGQTAKSCLIELRVEKCSEAVAKALEGCEQFIGGM